MSFSIRAPELEPGVYQNDFRVFGPRNVSRYNFILNGNVLTYL